VAAWYLWMLWQLLHLHRHLLFSLLHGWQDRREGRRLLSPLRHLTMHPPCQLYRGSLPSPKSEGTKRNCRKFSGGFVLQLLLLLLCVDTGGERDARVLSGHGKRIGAMPRNCLRTLKEMNNRERMPTLLYCSLLHWMYKLYFIFYSRGVPAS